MTETVVSDAVRYPQDEGIDAVTDGNEPWMSAGTQGVMAGWLGGSYRYAGLTLTNLDTTNEQVDVTAGAAYLEVDAPVDVQSILGGSSVPAYDTSLPVGVLPVVAVILPTDVSGVGLGTDTTNDLWLAYATDGSVTGVSAGDVYIRHGSGLSAPPHPNIKLGTADSSSGGTASNADNQAADPTGTVGGTDTETTQEIVNQPNGQIERVEIEDTSIVDFGVAVPAGYTLEVYRWGCWRQDDTTPTGLDVVLLDESRTVQASANTDDSGDNTVVEASLANSSGSLSHYYLGIQNGTGSDLLASNSEWVTGIFAYQVV